MNNEPNGRVQSFLPCGTCKAEMKSTQEEEERIAGYLRIKVRGSERLLTIEHNVHNYVQNLNITFPHSSPIELRAHSIYCIKRKGRHPNSGAIE